MSLLLQYKRTLAVKVRLMHLLLLLCFVESINARGGLSAIKGVHCGMGQVLHAVRLPAQAVRAAGDGARRQGAQHDAEENTGRGEHRPQGT